MVMEKYNKDYIKQLKIFKIKKRKFKKNIAVIKVKNNKAKKSYTYIKFHLHLSVRTAPQWRGGCGVCGHIISNNNNFVSEYVNSPLFIRYSISSWLKSLWDLSQSHS